MADSNAAGTVTVTDAAKGGPIADKVQAAVRRAAK